MEEQIYDNSNIAESYAGVTTPLTYSFARYVYQEVYQHFSRMMGAGNKLIKNNQHIFEHMIEFIGYRIYYNLNSWYAMLLFFPGHKLSGEFMEKMMGVETHKPLFKKNGRDIVQKYLYNLPKAAVQIIKISLTFLFLGWRMKQFNKYFDRIFFVFNTADLKGLNLLELKKLFHKADDKLLSQWRVPIANDFAVMISVGLSDRLFKKWLVSNDAFLHISARSHKPLTTLDPGNKIIKIVNLIQRDEEIEELFVNNYLDIEVLSLLKKKHPTHQITHEIQMYLRDFGSRMPNELKLESETLVEKPEKLIMLLRAILQNHSVLNGHTQTKLQHAKFDAKGTIKNTFLSLLLRWASNSICRREEARFRRSLVFGFVRRIFLEVGEQMEQKKIIQNSRDIFYLTVDEIFRIIDSKHLEIDPIGIVEQRKREYEKWREIEFPQRIETYKKIPEIESEIYNQSILGKGSLGQQLFGRVASCPSGAQLFSGVAVTVKTFDPAVDYLGKILVTRHTDPGWTIIFPLLSGVIVERGGMLSHAAIVAREMNIPCIVNVKGATEIIPDGAHIQLDLTSGKIQIS